MFHLMQKRRLYYLISAILVIPGLVAMIYSSIAFGAPLKLSIDFKGGSLLELRFENPVSLDDVRTLLLDSGLEEATVQTVGNEKNVVIRTKQIDIATKQVLEGQLSDKFGQVTELRFESVGPTIGRETTRAAILAIIAAAVATLFFIAIAFRKIPNSFRYGVCAVAKMFHDILVILGLASILGIIAHWEIDSLFLTAMVTVIGFSVQDVIVVFDRIRENINRHRGEPFEVIVDRSLLETLHRSLATQLNAIFIMIAIIFFGGVTIRQFMLVMLVGMTTGTYSSLFFAVSLLVSWEKGDWKQLFRHAGSEKATA